jgi:hypothetical protein
MSKCFPVLLQQETFGPSTQGLGEGAILPSIVLDRVFPFSRGGERDHAIFRRGELVDDTVDASPRREPFSIAPAAWQVSRKSTALPASDLSAFLLAGETSLPIVGSGIVLATEIAETQGSAGNRVRSAHADCTISVGFDWDG